MTRSASDAGVYSVARAVMAVERQFCGSRDEVNQESTTGPVLVFQGLCWVVKVCGSG